MIKNIVNACGIVQAFSNGKGLLMVSQPGTSRSIVLDIGASNGSAKFLEQAVGKMVNVRGQVRIYPKERLKMRVFWAGLQYINIVAVGNLGGDPEMRFSSSGKGYTNASLAMSYGQGDERKADWLNFTAFDSDAIPRAEQLANVVKNETPIILIEGQLQQDDNPDGGVYTAKAIVNDFRAFGRRPDTGNGNTVVGSHDDWATAGADASESSSQQTQETDPWDAISTEVSSFPPDDEIPF